MQRYDVDIDEGACAGRHDFLEQPLPLVSQTHAWTHLRPRILEIRTAGVHAILQLDMRIWRYAVILGERVDELVLGALNASK